MQKWEKRFAFYVFGLIGLAMFCGCSAGIGNKYDGSAVWTGIWVEVENTK